MFHLKRILATTLAIGALAIIGMAVLPQQSAQANGHKEFKKVHCEKYLKKCELTRVKELRGKELRAADDLYQINRELLTFAPVATIDSPADGAEFSTWGRGDRSCTTAGDCSSSSVEVVLKGSGLDREDGKLSGSSLEWRVNSPVLGRTLFVGVGEEVHVSLFEFGQGSKYLSNGWQVSYTEYDISLTARDSNNNAHTETIRITVMQGTNDPIF